MSLSLNTKTFTLDVDLLQSSRFNTLVEIVETEDVVGLVAVLGVIEVTSVALRNKGEVCHGVCCEGLVHR